MYTFYQSLLILIIIIFLDEPQLFSIAQIRKKLITFITWTIKRSLAVPFLVL